MNRDGSRAPGPDAGFRLGGFGPLFALLDDVTTTGHTLQELAAALVGQGAASVDGWCVARADRRGAPPAGACFGTPAGRRDPTPACGSTDSAGGSRGGMS